MAENARVFWPLDEADPVDDESVKHRLFSCALQSVNGYTNTLHRFLRLAEHIAKGTVPHFPSAKHETCKSLASMIEANRYVESLATENLEGIDISSVTFDAARPFDRRYTFLRQWVLWSDRAFNEFEVKQSFQFIQRNGGATVAAAMALPVDIYGVVLYNAYSLIAQSWCSSAVRQFIEDPVLAPGFNSFTNEDTDRSPLIHSAAQGQESTAGQILSVANDDTLNYLDETGKSALWYAIYRARFNLLYELLRRPALDMNNCSTSIYRALDHMEPCNQQRIMHLFDQAAALFAHVPHLIHETVYRDSYTSLPLPICDIIFNYYRMPYPIKDAATATQTLITTTATAAAGAAAATAANQLF